MLKTAFCFLGIFGHTSIKNLDGIVYDTYLYVTHLYSTRSVNNTKFGFNFLTEWFLYLFSDILVFLPKHTQVYKYMICFQNDMLYFFLH